MAAHDPDVTIMASDGHVGLRPRSDRARRWLERDTLTRPCWVHGALWISLNPVGEITLAMMAAGLRVKKEVGP